MRKLIRADGTEMPLDKPLSISGIEALIGADCLDSFTLADRVHVCFVDDNGWETETIEHGPGHFELRGTKPRKPINEKASLLYWERCGGATEHKIVGDVVICPDEDFA
jgi:hypothetical protein